MSKRIRVPVALTNRAHAGNAKAQFELAELYMSSEHEEDIALAEEWALKAGQLGNVEAMYWLGEGYTFYAKEVLEADPEDAKQNFEYGYNWLTQAAKHQHAAAILELAGYYRRGNVVEKDLAKSVELVQQAAELGDAQAMRDLSAIYAHGLGVEIDEDKAVFWNEKANVAEQ